MRSACFLGIFAIASTLVSCSEGDGGVVPPPDSSWLDFGVDVAPETPTCTPSDAPLGDGVVTTDLGPVKGAQHAGVWSFKNIPYAAPPIGALRWRPPQAAPCWSDVRDATSWGAMCPQSDVTATAPVQGSEDCLQLNVWTKTPSAGASKPVIVFVHGGGFVVGSAVETASDGTRVYDAESLVAREDVVVVTINYRLGALGFFAHPGLANEDARFSTGNYGVLDQIAALQWVKRNAASFGGDASHVTLVGEGAGGVSVCALIASPMTKDLFSQAIVQSGGCEARASADAESFGNSVVRAAKCDTAADVLSCMRALSAEQVIGASPVPLVIDGASPPYAPVIDGSFLTGAPLDVIEAGGHRAVPVIFGNDGMETSRQTTLKQDASASDYQSAVAALYPASKDAVLAAYPSSDYASPWAAWVALTSDAKFVCPTRRVTRAFLDGQDLPVYRYLLAHALDDAPASKPLGAWHGVDVLYLFDHLGVGGYVPSDTEKTLVGAIEDDWAHFSAGSTPSDAWPEDDSSDTYLVFDTTIAAAHGLRSAQCDFWDSVSK